MKDCAIIPVRRRTGTAWAGCATVGLFILLAARFWHPVFGFTRFLQFDEERDRTKISALGSLPIFIYSGTEGYDGMAYAQIACSPLLTAPDLGRAIDNLSYRSRRILLPALSWVLGLGQPARIVQAYSALNILFWLVLAAVLWRLIEVQDARGWCAWAGVLFSAGALGSVRFALTDLPAVALLAAGMLACEKGRRGWAAGALAAAALARETALAALPGFWMKGRSGAVRLLLAVVPLAAWICYIRWKLGPADQPWNNFTWPLIGLVNEIQSLLLGLPHAGSSLYLWLTIVSTAGMCIQACYLTLKPEPGSAWWRLGISYVLLMFLLGQPVWEGYPGASPRVLLPMALAFNVLAARRKAALAWLIAGNLSILAGIAAIGNVHSCECELGFGHTGPLAYEIRARNGWYGSEHDARHRWDWCGGAGRMEIETWPRVDGRATVELSVVGFGSRRVFIRQNGVELGSGYVSSKGTSLKLLADVSAGISAFEISSDRPPLPEGPWPLPRQLAFAVYDPKLTLLR